MSLNKSFVIIILVLTIFFTTDKGHTQTNKLMTKVVDFSFTEEADNFKLNIVTDKSLTYTSYTAESPWKLVMEFPLTDFGNFKGGKEINRDGIKNYLVKQIGSVGRVEVNFTTKPDFNIEKTTKSLNVLIKKVSAEAEKKALIGITGEPNVIKNVIFSGDQNRFLVILETTTKPEYMSYVLKNPLRIVFDLANSKYEGGQSAFVTKNNIIKSIRVETFPTLTRFFLDLTGEVMPSFLATAENNKLVIEFSTEELTSKEKKAPPIFTLDTVDFKPEKDRTTFRLRGISDKEIKFYKLKENLFVFDILGINLHKDLQKTYDTKNVSDLVKSFTFYQVKPEDEHKVRFVVDLKVPALYKTVKKNGDLEFEFYKAGEEKKESVALTAKEPTFTPPPVEKKEVPTTPLPTEKESKEEKEVPKTPALVEVKEEKKEEEKPKVAEIEKEKKETEKPEKTIVKTKEEPKQREEKTVKIEEKPKEREIIKEVPPVAKEAKADLTPKVEERKGEEKGEVKSQEKQKPIVVSIKSQEEPKEEKTKSIPTQYKGRPITINLKDAEIQHIFKLIAEVAKLDGETLNIITSDDVRGKVSIQLEEVPWDQVLDVVLEVNNLGMKRIGNILRVMPKEKLKKEQEDLIAASKIKEKLENLVLEIVPINYADASDFEAKIKPLLSTRGSVTVDKRNNSLIINDLKENINEAKKLIAKLDTPPQQVVIEARVVEATSDFSKEMGIQWGAKYYKDILGNRYRAGVSGPSSRVDLTSDPTFPVGVGGGGTLNLTPPSPVPYFVNLPAAVGQGAGGGINFALVNLRNGVGLDIQLTAMENKGMGKILSRPRITTLNNVEANIQQGSSIPYETLSDKGTQTQFIDASLMLTVTPRITPDNSIILKVKVSNNNPNTALRSAGGVPSIDKNEASTEILVRDGQTIVIGGIIRNKETQLKSGVPFLMDIPLIGWLFRKEAKTVENRELLIFLTPNIIRNVTEADAS